MKSKIKLMLLASLVAVAGCSNRTNDMVDTSGPRPLTVEPLVGCVYTLVQIGKYTSMNVIRCPNSSTSTSWQSGKTIQSAVVIDETAVANAKKVLEQAEALKRISPEDKKLLGLQ